MLLPCLPVFVNSPKKISISQAKDLTQYVDKCTD